MIINCPECGREISDKTPTCVSCGYPINKMKNKSVKQKRIGEYHIRLSGFWKSQIGRFRLHEDKVTFSSAKYILGVFPGEVSEHSILLSDLTGTSIKKPSSFEKTVRKIGWIVFIVFITMFSIGAIILTKEDSSVGAIFIAIFSIFLIFACLVRIADSSSSRLILNTKEYMKESKNLLIVESDVRKARAFIEDINKAQARDFNYIRRAKPSKEIEILVEDY